MLIFPIIFTYLIVYNLRKYHLFKTISEIHESTPLFLMFVKLKVIWVKLRIL